MSHEQQITISPSAIVSEIVTAEDICLRIDVRLRLDETLDEPLDVRPAQRRQPTRRDLARLACEIYDARRARQRMFDRNLFGEPAWDMLLALYCLPARGEQMSVTALAYAADVPPSTGHRWQNTLRDAGLMERGCESADARRQTVRLTENGRALMEEYLTRLFHSETSAPPQPEAAGR